MASSVTSHADPRSASPIRRVVGGVAFVVVAAFSLALPVVPWSVKGKVAAAVGLTVPAGYLLLGNLPLFVPALFFVLNAVASPFVFLLLDRLPFAIPQVYFLPPMLIYLSVVFAVPRLRKHAYWLKTGRFDKLTLGLVAVLVLGSAGALVAWGFANAEVLPRFRAFIPDVSLGALIGYGFGFAIMNSCFEEFIARALLYDGFSLVFGNLPATVVAQAILFAAWHYDGFPGGAVGVAMVFVWSILLGAIRHTSKGMLAPLIAHFFADATIALFILLTVVPA